MIIVGVSHCRDHIVSCSLRWQVVDGQEEQVHGAVIHGEHQDQAQGLQKLIRKSNEIMNLYSIVQSEN